MDMVTLSGLIATLTAALLVSPSAPAATPGSAGTVDLSRPGTLQRGDDLRVPHLVGGTVVDGDVRVEVPGALALLGRSGDDYVVQVRRERGARHRVLRVTRDGVSTALVRGQQAQAAQLSDDGEHIVSSDWARRTRLTAYDTTVGDVVASRVFRIYPEVLDIDGGRVLVATWQPHQRTVAWDLAGDTRALVLDRVGYEGDLSADRLAYFTGDPYQGGRSRVVTLTDPDTVRWQSGRQRVYAFSPEGDLAATVDMLADGAGPGEVQLREIAGQVLVRYTATWFSQVHWEDADTLLLEANGRHRGATVRCDGTDCDRASDVVPTSP